MNVRRLSGSALACIVLVACTGEPVAPSGEYDVAERATVAPGHARMAPQVVAAASGAGRFTLLLDLTGDGIDDPIDQVLGFNAARYEDGTVAGQITYHQIIPALDLRLRFKARVTCIGVYDGNRVKFGGEITQSTDPTVPVGTFIWFHSFDNGEGASSPPDRSSGSGFGDEAANEAFCNSPALPNPQFQSDVNGNIQVVG